ncbi:MAG: SspB family protein [Hyphomicrobiaceae bacterium]
MTAGRSIDYDVLTQDALRGVVRTVLIQIAEHGLPGEHHFYIAFDTQAPSVVLSRRLKDKYPEEMTIVLQHRFWDLVVGEDRFEVKLTFDSIPERLVIPFSAIRMFVDPSARFTLQFNDGSVRDEQGERSGVRRPIDSQAVRFGQRGPGERRPRQRSKPKNDVKASEDAETPMPQGGDKTPTVLLPRAPEGAAAQTPNAATGSASDNEPRELPSGGAKVFSLDQFRNKK